MTAQEFEMKLDDLVTEAYNAGLPSDDIITALQLKSDELRDEEEGQ